jgi:hypothetical protein
MKRVLFVQSFEMQGQAGGGSAKIFRSLIDQAPAEVSVAVYGVCPPRQQCDQRQFFVRERGTLGRLENSRLAPYVRTITRAVSWQKSGARLSHLMTLQRPDHVHLHIHGLGFIHASQWCRDNNVGFSVSIHDDIRHQCPGPLWTDFTERATAKAWSDAVNRFVISPEMGEEYCKRYGAQPWVQITDGLTPDAILTGPRDPVMNRLSVYFAGAVNLPYEPNFRALQQALKLYQERHPTTAVRLILRGGRHFAWDDPAAPRIEVRPFGETQDVEKDFADADLLYLPLSMDPAFKNFAQFSLSTKMVTYLGSGLPILYHGPIDSAAYALVGKTGACLVCCSNDPEEICALFEVVADEREKIVPRALQLAKSRFTLATIREQFWSAINAGINCR